MTRDDESLTPGQRAVLAALDRYGVPVTRENYIAANWNDDPPDPWTAEDEAELPEFLQDKDDDEGGDDDDDWSDGEDGLTQADRKRLADAFGIALGGARHHIDSPTRQDDARSDFDPSEARKPGGGPGGGQWTGGGGAGTGGASALGRPHGGTPAGTTGGAGAALGRDGGLGRRFNPVNAAQFSTAIAAAKAANPYAAAVELHSPEEYQRMKTFTTPDGLAGFALDGDNIVSVFRHPKGPKGAVKGILDRAVAEGGKRLDAFDTVLPKLYAQSGFRAVARLAFNPEYAPPGWDYDKFQDFNGGKPDVVFMVHDPAFGAAYRAGDGKQVADYDAGIAEQQKALAGQSPGHGYSASATLDANGVIQTDNVDDAMRALFEKRKVELHQQREVATLLDRLGAVSRRMIKYGAKAPVFDLCNVSVPGTNLFCASSFGIPRVKMPQIMDADRPRFLQLLARRGATVTPERADPAYLRATQNELNGAKVAGIAAKMRAGTAKPKEPIFVSKEDYVLDGHHRWAAQVGLAAESGQVSGTTMDVMRVSMPITDLLQAANDFTGGKGARAVGDKKRADAFNPDEPRDPTGKWTDGSHLGGLRSVATAQARGGWAFKPKETTPRSQWGAPERTSYHIAPTDIPSHWTTGNERSYGTEFFDPQHAHMNEDGYVVPNDPDGDEAAIPKAQEPGVIYRGMSWEDYQNGLKSGQFQSRGEYNIGEAQKGLTYWTSEPSMARSYATGFAPWQFMATPNRPAVIVAAHDPGGHVGVKGTDPREVGLPGAIPASQVSHVFMGRPSIVTTGQMDVQKSEDGDLREGSSSAPTSYVRWSRETLPGVKANGVAPAAALKSEWSKTSPIKTVDDLMNASFANQDALRSVGQEIAQATGVPFAEAPADLSEPGHPGVKRRFRIEDKLQRKPGRGPGGISDAVRGGFKVSTPEQADAVVATLAKHFEVADEGWALTAEGYFDRKALVRFGNGQIGEVQIWEPNVLDAKEKGGGHQAYERMQSLRQSDPRYWEAVNEQRRIYGAAAANAGPSWGSLIAQMTPTA